VKVDQIHEMVRGANPVPNLDVFEPIEMPFLPDRERSGEMSRKQIDVETPGPRKPRVRRGLAIGAAAAALVIIVGVVAFVFVGDDGTDVAGSGEVETGPITSFEDIAGTTYERQGLGGPDFIYFFEDGTWHYSSNPDLVVDRPIAIFETRFEGTTVFVNEIKGGTCAGTDAIYEIHLLENGNLQFVEIEDTCALRSSFFSVELAPVP